MGKKKFEFYDGQFLNRPGYHTDATIQSHIIVEEKYGDSTKKQISGQVRIRDCSECIELDLYVSTNNDGIDEEAYENNLAKLDVMIDSLKKVRAAYKKARKKV